jgi:hypothetical protein
MFRFVTLITLVVFASANAYSQPEAKQSHKQLVVVIKTLDGNKVKGLLSGVGDGSVSLMKLDGKDTARQTFQAQAIEWIKYRKKRSALANSALLVGAVAAAGLSTAAWSARPIGSSDLTTANVVLGSATAVTALFLTSRLVRGLPITLRIDGNPAIFNAKKYRLVPR